MATKVIDLTSDSWTFMAATPCLIQIVGENPITFVFEDEPPAPEFEGHLLGTYAAREDTADLNEGGNVYARALYGATKVAVSV